MRTTVLALMLLALYGAGQAMADTTDNFSFTTTVVGPFTNSAPLDATGWLDIDFSAPIPTPSSTDLRFGVNPGEEAYNVVAGEIEFNGTEFQLVPSPIPGDFIKYGFYVLGDDAFYLPGSQADELDTFGLAFVAIDNSELFLNIAGWNLYGAPYTITETQLNIGIPGAGATTIIYDAGGTFAFLPEPSSATLAITGMLGFGGIVWQKRASRQSATPVAS